MESPGWKSFKIICIDMILYLSVIKIKYIILELWGPRASNFSSCRAID